MNTDHWELPKPVFSGPILPKPVFASPILEKPKERVAAVIPNGNKRIKIHQSHDLRWVLMTKRKSLSNEEDYVIDSGCTQSILMNKSKIVNYKSYRSTMLTANEQVLVCVGVGDLIVNNELTIQNVLHCPEVAMNLLSSTQICDQGNTMHIDKDSLEIRQGKRIILRAKRKEGLYQFSISENRALVLSGSQRTTLAHRKTGHLNFQSLRLLSHISDGLVLDNDPTTLCRICAQTKSTRAPFPPSTSMAKRIGEITHCDLCHIGVKTIIGEHIMFLVLLDDATRYLNIRLLSNKDDASDHIISYSKAIYNTTGRKLSILQCDGGGEFINGYLQEYCKEEGIHIRTSSHYTPEQNSRAERVNRSIIEGVSSMLLDCQLPWSFWGFAAEAFVYTKNRSPHSKLFRSTPYEQWFGRALDLTNLHVFGFICYVHIPKEIRKRQGPGNKLLPKATKMIFVGYATNKKAWKCFDPATKTTIETIHVRFDDESVPANGPSTAITSFHEAIVQEKEQLIPR